MAITITFHESEAVFVAGAIASNVEREREFLYERNRHGTMNDLIRESIKTQLEAHRTLLKALRAVGYPMANSDIEDRDIDQYRELTEGAAPGQWTFGKWHIAPSSVSYAKSTDWSFWHDDYDGAEDANDPRHGYGSSKEACVEAILEWEAEQ